jgi:hypothetical protein
MANEQEIKDNLKALEDSIFEAKSAYTLWKVIAYSRSSGVVPLELAEKYVKSQQTAPAFFIMAERTALISFVILILHPIDQDSRSFSLFNVNKEKTNEFIKQNEKTVENLRLVRNKVFAHKDSVDALKILVPSIEIMDNFFENMISFYNNLTSEHNQSITDFNASCDNLIHEMEYMFMNLTRGEKIRLEEIDLEWMWEKNPKKISDIFDSKNNKKS